ncbi:hypothetical protein AB0H83_19665 [Dactylosporangium sp. NPDC050688]|uniref:hypothetical protein n=1 Tax=Dactylosporangium sp. NPDC050688 TaxID=3157217 RepID=UPI00340DC26C
MPGRSAPGTPLQYTGDTVVVLSLRGGFDGLSAVVPIGDPDYYTARPTIAVPKGSVIAGDGTFGLHPAFAPLLARWNAGTFGAVHAVGLGSLADVFPNVTPSSYGLVAART